MQRTSHSYGILGLAADAVGLMLLWTALYLVVSGAFQLRMAWHEFRSGDGQFSPDRAHQGSRNVSLGLVLGLCAAALLLRIA